MDENTDHVTLYLADTISLEVEDWIFNRFI